MRSFIRSLLAALALTACGGHVNGAPDASAGPSDCGALMTCGNECAALAEDSRHCGSCDNNCGGGGCVNGVCQQNVELAAGGLRLAINSEDVVWTDGDTSAGGSVYRCAKRGCGAKPALVAAAVAGPVFGSVAISDVSVFWAGDSRLDSCPISGCSSAQGFATFARDVVSESGRVYWVSAEGQVFSCSTSGCLGPPRMDAAESGTARALALGPTTLLFAFRASGGPGVYVVSCPLTGCDVSPFVFVRGENDVDAITADAANVYWSGPSFDAASHSVIKTCPLSGCPNGVPIVLASGQPRATSISTDGISVYWGNEGIAADGGAPALSGGVMRCAVGGCGGAPTLVAESPGGAVSVVVDEQSVYWIKLQQGPGRSGIMKTAK